jgi:hypothetical protein
MKYMLLIYGEEARRQTMTEQDQQQEMASYFGYNDELRAAGVMVAGEALYPTQSATTLRIRNGETVTTDGPFAETREALGGFYIIDVPSLDNAIEWANKLAAFSGSTIEIRPLVVFG